MKISEVLSSAEKWTQGTSARDKDGYSVEALSSTAVKWCLLGAAIVCYPDPADLYPAIDRLRRVLSFHEGLPSSIAPWNDYPGRTFEEIQVLLRKAGE